MNVTDLRARGSDPLNLWGGDPPAWQDAALCAQTDPEAFHPERGGSTEPAKKICQRCEVRQECLEYALAAREEFGVWGGMSEPERKDERERRKTRTPTRQAA